MISQESIQKVLGIEEKAHLTTGEMAKQLKVVFYPDQTKASSAVKIFASKFEKSLIRLGVEVVSFESIWEYIPTSKRLLRFFKYLINDGIWIIRKIFRFSEVSFFIPFKTILQLSGGKRVKKGICIICVGEQEISQLSMQYISSFKTNSIITILDFPTGIDESSNFSNHFDTAMALFAYHMTNIVIAVDQSKWMVYNFNASHPIYSIEDLEFDLHIQNAIIPKIVAPISPHKFKDFLILSNRFNINDSKCAYAIKEMRRGAEDFSKTGLYPQGKKIDELPFRHNLHKLIGKLHLDNRSGMSFGFIAMQMPVELHKVKSHEEFKSNYPKAFLGSDYFFDQLGNLYILTEICGQRIVLKVPDVWVMTLRSGADKTNFNLKQDLLQIGLVNGKMCMQFPENLKINRDYKPSFDTKVILAHAVGNALVAQMSEYLRINAQFIENIQKRGMAISHWHGYINQKLLPSGLSLYGHDNPHVSCSSPQSAIYALQGKLENFFDKLNDNKNHEEYLGDVHVEPHHGINISYPNLIDLAGYILEHPDATELGNRYL